MFTFGNPRLIAQGCVDQTSYDLKGEVTGYDKVANEVALNYEFELNEVTGGFQNQLIGLIPHSTRLSGTYTSASFSLKQRALATGGNLKYNGIQRVCEEITAEGTTLTVTGEPARFYAQPTSDTVGWAYVHEKGATSYDGTNYGVDLTTKEIQDFTAESGKTYEVTYFQRNASAEELGLKVAANPNIGSIIQRWGIYCVSNQSVKDSPLWGYLYVVVPRVMFSEGGGLDGSQTEASTTSYNWRAISPTEDLPDCEVCGSNDDNYAYYVLVPCGDATQLVEDLAIIGGGISVAAGNTKQLPVKYVMPNGELVVPNYSDLTYSIPSTSSSVATVDDNGVVTGVGSGEATATIKLVREDKTITATCSVTVTAS